MFGTLLDWPNPCILVATIRGTVMIPCNQNLSKYAYCIMQPRELSSSTAIDPIYTDKCRIAKRLRSDSSGSSGSMTC